jgi:hypothetical protein
MHPADVEFIGAFLRGEFSAVASDASMCAGMQFSHVLLLKIPQSVDHRSRMVTAHLFPLSERFAGLLVHPVFESAHISTRTPRVINQLPGAGTPCTDIIGVGSADAGHDLDGAVAAGSAEPSNDIASDHYQRSRHRSGLSVAGCIRTRALRLVEDQRDLP